MSKKIWPYWLEGSESERVASLPVGATALSVYWRGHAVCLSVLFSEETPTEDRRFLVATYGEPVPEDATYIGTVTLDMGQPIHVFELREGA